MEEKLRLNDRTVLDGSAVTAGNELFLYLSGTLEEAFFQLREKRKTKKIIYMLTVRMMV